MAFLNKIKKLRTNENILIAVDVLSNSKSSFLGIFLMSFMISVSLKNSPAGYISMELSNYAFDGILCVIFADILRAHPIAAWRTSMLFSMARVIAVILISPDFPLFPLIIGFLAGVEAQLYWRPKIFLETKEVSNARRARFSSLKQILIEITKIAMPIILGIVISDTGYRRAANIVLIISVVQLLLSILMRPTHKIETKPRPLKEALRFAVTHKNVRLTLWMQFLRGIILTGCAYEIVAQINIYRSDSSNIELGSFQSAASFVAIVLLMLYRRLKTKSPKKCNAFVFGLLPAIILLPISAIVFPGNFIIAIALFIYSRSAVHALYNSTIFAVYQQDEFKHSIHDDAFMIDMEILGELWLCVGRVISIVPLLFFIIIGRDDWALPLIAAQAAVAPILIYIIHKSVTSRALDKR